MVSLQLVALLAFFAAMALAMFFRLLPALIALPLMACGTALLGGVAPADVVEHVIGQGSLKLHAAYTVTMFGCMLGMLLQKAGIAECIVKRGAEFSGDRPWTLAVAMLCLLAVLFTTLVGLGAIIMVATIVLPIMSAAGIGPLTSVGIFLFGLSVGGILNVANWAVYTSVLGLPIESVRPFALAMFALTFATALVYITLQLHSDGHDIDLAGFLGRGAVLAAGVAGAAVLWSWAPPETRSGLAAFFAAIGALARRAVAAGLALLFAAAAVKALGARDEDAGVHWIAWFAPLVPLALILLFGVHFVPAFLAGIIYAFLATYRPKRLNLLIQSIFEGGAAAMPAVALMFGIGMLLVSIMGPGGPLPAYPDGWPVLRLIKPVIVSLVPSTPLTYLLLFGLTAPLALYRGPYNVWGMGYGLAAVFLAGGMRPAAVMGLLMSVGQVQGISDPTNTHNIWLSSEMRVDVQKVLWNTLPYTWAVAFLGLALSTWMNAPGS